MLSDYLMYTQKELFEMNHMKEGTRHVYKIKYNYSITQIFWRELNKYPIEEMKPTYFFGGSKECVSKNAHESEQTSEMVNIQISHGRIVKKEPVPTSQSTLLLKR